MTAPHILIIDNYDSFVHNLERYVKLTGARTSMIRNDEKSVADIKAIAPDGIIISPGPKTPKDAGICIDLIRALSPNTPILGVCLGHQAIGEAYGGTTKPTGHHMHGRARAITHTDDALFTDIPSPFEGGLYHSLITDITDAPDLRITATAKENIIMGIKHVNRPTYGIQFHPESLLTPDGQKLIQNFIDIVIDWKA